LATNKSKLALSLKTYDIVAFVAKYNPFKILIGYAVFADNLVIVVWRTVEFFSFDNDWSAAKGAFIDLLEQMSLDKCFQARYYFLKFTAAESLLAIPLFALIQKTMLSAKGIVCHCLLSNNHARGGNNGK